MLGTITFCAPSLRVDASAPREALCRGRSRPPASASSIRDRVGGLCAASRHVSRPVYRPTSLRSLLLPGLSLSEASGDERWRWWCLLPPWPGFPSPRFVNLHLLLSCLFARSVRAGIAPSSPLSLNDDSDSASPWDVCSTTSTYLVRMLLGAAERTLRESATALIVRRPASSRMGRSYLRVKRSPIL